MTFILLHTLTVHMVLSLGSISYYSHCIIARAICISFGVKIILLLEKIYFTDKVFL